MKLMDQRNRIRKIKKEVSEGNTIIGEWESDGKVVMDGQKDGSGDWLRR